LAGKIIAVIKFDPKAAVEKRKKPGKKCLSKVAQAGKPGVSQNVRVLKGSAL
jgi:hypothetical protein